MKNELGAKEPFARLDEPAKSWEGDVGSLEKFLLRPAEKRRREDDLKTILTNPEYRRLAVNQLMAGLNLIKTWERNLESFMQPRRLFLIERVIAQLELMARLTTYDAWPEFFAVIEEYKRARDRTAGVRFGAVRSVFAQVEE